MTRGRIMYTEENKSVITVEFNGDMGPLMECGEYILDTVMENNTVEDFKEYIKIFNSKFFQNEGNLFTTFSYNLGKEVERLRYTDYVYIYDKRSEIILIYHFGELHSKFYLREHQICAQ